MWPARPGAPRACARAGAPARMEATSRGPAGEGAVAGGEGAVARVSRGHLARASFRGLMESRSCALCAVRCARGEERGPGASFAPGDGLLGNQTVAIAFLSPFSGTETEGGLGKHGNELLGEAWQKYKP